MVTSSYLERGVLPKIFFPTVRRIRGLRGHLRARGVFETSIEVVNRLLVPAFGKRLMVRSVPRDLFSSARRRFADAALRDSGEGYFYLNPMPSEADLNRYYRDIYHFERPVVRQNHGRDFEHLEILQREVPEILRPGSTFVNFGAGTATISSLLAFTGLEVFNVEPGPFRYHFGRSLKALSEIPARSVDVFYASHALEHVQDLKLFQRETARILKKDGLAFFEVPNDDSQGGTRKAPPHTYYFTRDFFYRWFENVLFCELDEEEKAIRVIGSIS